MKKKYVNPTMEKCEYVVAARLEGSSIGIAHSAAPSSDCTKTASQGTKKCAEPSVSQSNIGNTSC